MLPYDGIGFGPSRYWPYKAQEAITSTNENCTHDEKIANIFSDITKPFCINFHISCPECDAKFPKSEEELTKEFLKMYGMKV